ncbi:MAG: hypothetical protein Q9168_002895 [Polycauliona sp. 1 TL-2023]
MRDCSMDHQFRTKRILSTELGTSELRSLWEFANSAFAHSAAQYPEMGFTEGKRFEQPSDFTEEMGIDGVTFIHYHTSSSPGDIGNATIVATAGCKPWSSALKLDERVKRMREEREARDKEPANAPESSNAGFYTKEHEEQLLKQIEKLGPSNHSQEQDGIPRWEVMTVCVHPDWQKRGLADKLLGNVAEEVSSRVKSSGKGPDFKLMVRTMKEINERYWLSKGFKSVSERFFEPGLFGSPTGFHLLDLSRDHRIG